MKKIISLCLCFLFAVSVYAVDYCAASSWGYAGNNVTGGGNASVTTVSSASALVSALNKKSNKVVVITSNITFTSLATIQDAENITIMALPGVKLISTQSDKSNSGILYIKRCSNVIIRNLTFEGPGAHDVNGSDNLCFEDVTRAWVDHCDFSDGCDGNFDIKGESDNITVSWCRFHYDKDPIPGGSGGSDDHRYSNLLGSGASDKPSDGTYNITYAYCWWDEGCKERMVRGRNASIHFLNCYWNSSVANYYIGPENVDCYIEGCRFEGAPAQNKIFYENYGGTNGATFVNCTASKGVPANVTARTVLVPSYSYTALSAADAKTAVTNSTCGAGATLTVTSTAAVSSSCDSEDPDPQPQPQPGDSTITWNFSDAAFNALGTISTTTTINGLTLVAKTDTAMAIDASNKTVDGHTFTHRLKTNGTGKSTSRHLYFSVTGACTIEVYLVSGSSSSERTLNIYSGSYGGTLLTTLSAGTTPDKQSYEYTGEATTIYMGSASSGINIYGINVKYAETPSAVDLVPNKSAAHKVLRNGQVFIVRDGKTYDLLGR